MAKILVNYIYNKKKDEYKLMDESMVFAEMPIAVMDTDEVINEPLIVLKDGVMTVTDRKTYEINHKKFKLTANEFGKVVEDPNGVLEAWLPKDTDVSKLRLINNTLVLVENEETNEPEESKKVKVKKVTNEPAEETLEKEN